MHSVAAFVCACARVRVRLMEDCCQVRDGSGDHWVPEVFRLSH